MNKTMLNNRSLTLCFVWLVAILASAVTLTSCKDNDDKYVSPELSIEQQYPNNTIAFEQAGGTAKLTIKTNRAWHAESDNDWIETNPTKGEEGKHEIIIRVQANNGQARKGGIRIIASGKSFFYTITQKSVSGGEYSFTPLSTIEAMLPNDNREGILIEDELAIRAVVASDYKGKQFQFQNFHYIVDKDGNGIVVTLDKNEKPFEKGDQITAHIKGAKIVNYNGTVQLALSRDKVEVVPNQAIEPIKTSIAELKSGRYHNVLVRLEKVQFEKYENELMYSGSFFMKSHKIQDATGATIDVEVMKNSTFGTAAVPSGSGSIVAIVAIYKKNATTEAKYSLKPSLLTDMQMQDPRFSVGGTTPDPKPEEPPTVAPLSKLIEIGRELKPNETKELTEAMLIDVVVTADNSMKQLAGDSYHYVQDAEGTAMVLREAKGKAPHAIGSRLVINVKGAKLSNYFGSITFDVGSAQIEEKGSKPIEPKTIGIKELTQANQDKLVKLSDVQLKEVPASGSTLYNPKDKNYTKWVVVDRDGNSFQFEIKKGCTFGQATDFTGSGSITGIVTVFNKVYSIRPRTEADLQLKSARF